MFITRVFTGYRNRRINNGNNKYNIFILEQKQMLIQMSGNSLKNSQYLQSTNYS